MEEEFSLVIYTQAQYLIPNLLKKVVQFILSKGCMKLWLTVDSRYKNFVLCEVSS